MSALIPVNSSDADNSPTVILVDRVCFIYNFFGKKAQVLQDVNLSVQKGQIYGLIGASGCGKTTLLKCVIGLFKTSSGKVEVFGHPPGSSQLTGVPGKQLGYMPQEIALQESMTIGETFRYFARLHEMSPKQTKDRVRELLNELHLVEESRLVKNLSGGQQRRVSLGATLIHQPLLLILDEPTAGLDPVLKEQTWKMLERLVKLQSTTIIITTHYIEEMKRTDKVGFMRNGKILAEGHPKLLQQQLGCCDMEEVYLKLCQKDEKGILDQLVTIDSNQNLMPKKSNSLNIPIVQATKSEAEVNRNQSRSNIARRGALYSAPSMLVVIFAIFMKYIRLEIRNPQAFLIIYLSPFLFCGMIRILLDKAPRMDVAWVQEPQMFYNLSAYDVDKEEDFEYSLLDESTDLPGAIKAKIDPNYINLIDYDNYEEAYRDAKKTKVFGVLYIGKNFTHSCGILERRAASEYIDDATISAASIHVQVDETHILKREIVINSLYLAIYQFVVEFVNGTELQNFAQPLFAIEVLRGRPPNQILESIKILFMAGNLPVFFFCTALAIASLALFGEVQHSAFSRLYSVGVNEFHVALGYILGVFTLFSINVGLCMLLMRYLFEITPLGSWFWFLFIVALQTITAEAQGMILILLTEDVANTCLILCAELMILTIMSGGLYSVKAMPRALQVVAEILPFKTTVEAIKNLIEIGNEPFMSLIFPAILINTIYLIFTLIGLYLILKIKKF